MPRKSKPSLERRLALAFVLVVLVGVATAALFATGSTTGSVVSYVQDQEAMRRHMENLNTDMGMGMEMEMEMGRMSYAEMLRLMNQADRSFLFTLIGGIAQGGLIAVVLSILAAIYVSRRLVEPVNALQEAALRMAAGDFEVRTDPEAAPARELADLGEALNQLAASVGESERLRRNLVADVAHELRTPLAGLQSYAEGLRDGVIAPGKETYDTLLRETQRLSRLVNDLQELSLLEAGNLPIHPVPLEVQPAVEEAVAALAPALEQKELDCRVEVEPGLPRVEADPDRLLQVLRNLLNNAIKYTPEGGRVRVAARRRGHEVLIQVANTGPGISKADLPYVFERFYRGDRSRSRTTGGSGLGLTISKRLVEAQGGRISATSDPGGETVFEFTLPVADR